MRVASRSHEGGFGVATAWLATGFEVALMSHEVASRGHSAFCILPSAFPVCGGFDGMRDFHSSTAFRRSAVSSTSQLHCHWPVRVKAAQKYGFENSSLRSRDNCASRQAFARGSPERQPRMNSVVNRLVALSFTGQWLASTVCAPAIRKAQPPLARTNALAVTKRSNPLRAQQLCLREDRLYGFRLQVGRVAVFVQDALHHDFDLGTGAFAEGPVDGHALPHFGD